MTDAKDTPTEPSPMTDVSDVSRVPALDGSVDALVANLRAAKEQLAELLASADKASLKSDDKAA